MFALPRLRLPTRPHRPPHPPPTGPPAHPLWTQSMLLQKLKKTTSKTRGIQIASRISYETLAI